MLNEAPLIHNPAKEIIKNGGLIFGFNVFESLRPSIIKIAAQTGYNMLLVENEHVVHNEETLTNFLVMARDNGLAPTVVLPPNPAGVAELANHTGLEVQSGYLGSCASGRLEDLRAAATILKGRRVAQEFQLHIVPTSQAIMAAAAKEGLLATLIEAGAFVTSSSCDYCYGRIATMAKGQRAVSTGTLNVRGRMGSPDSEIYLCNAAAVAASAIEGRIADPRPYFVAAEK